MEKSNTHKSDKMRMIITGKDLVTIYDVNMGRPIPGHSPMRNTCKVVAILEMNEILMANNYFMTGD